MIPRTLVPKNASLATAKTATPLRTFTALDARTVVPAGLPVVELDSRSTIPAHVPLDVLGKRIVVPRDLPATPLETATALPLHLPLTVLDSRVVVPKGARPPEIEPRAPVPRQPLPELLEPDVLTTGDVNLMPRSIEAGPFRLRWAARIGSPLAHVLLIWLLVALPNLLPHRALTQQDIEMAHRSLGLVYLPPQVSEVPRIPSPPAELPSAKMRIDPRLLRQLLQPEREPSPLPGPMQPPQPHAQELPEAPRAQTPGTDLPPLPRAQEKQRQRDPGGLEPPPGPPQPGQIVLPPSSPGRALEESLRGAVRGRGGRTGEFGGPLPPAPGGGGGGQGYLGGAVQMLTPDEGVDFSNYLARVLASVRRNWYAVIPESARMGEKGRVVIQFHILKDGNVPPGEPVLLMTSGRDPLDRAAMASIRASNPFDPLPPAFSGAYIELRFIFLYNLPLDYQ